MNKKIINQLIQLLRPSLPKQPQTGTDDLPAKDLDHAKQIMAQMREKRDELFYTLLSIEMQNAKRTHGKLLSEMSHELRSPVNGVISIANLLLESDLPREQRCYIQTILASSQTLLKIIDDILDFSRIEAQKLELESVAFELKSVFDELITAVTRDLETKQLKLHIQVRPDVPTSLTGAKGRLRQILLHLTDNAIKYTDKGDIFIAVDSLVPDSEKSKTADDGCLLRFAVRDTGIGIAEDRLERLLHHLKNFNRAVMRQPEHSGLGLAIAKRLSEILGGEIGAQSTPGQGSEFWFTARFSTDNASREKTPVLPPILPDFSKSGAKILLVEDNPTNQLVALGILKKLGLKADTAANGYEAIEALDRVAYDLVLMDVQMPRLDGLQTTRQIRNHYAKVINHRIPIIALTACATIHDRQQCLDAGMDDFVTKPVLPQNLAAVLAQWLPSEYTACHRKHQHQ